MKLWFVNGKGWETSFTIVRAETHDDAVRVARVGSECEVIELPCEGEEQILWNWEHSPDSRDD